MWRVDRIPRPGTVKTALTPIRRRDTVENPEFAAFAARILRACARRVADGDVEGLAALVALRSELDSAIADAVAGLRHPQWAYSWSEIARVLGTTRQAAQQRYASKITDSQMPDSPEASERDDEGPVQIPLT
jgi:hypothetical protein